VGKQVSGPVLHWYVQEEVAAAPFTSAGSSVSLLFISHRKCARMNWFEEHFEAMSVIPPTAYLTWKVTCGKVHLGYKK